MLLAAAAGIITIISTALWLRLTEFPAKNRSEEVATGLPDGESTPPLAGASGRSAQPAVPADVAFTESLLALGRVGLRVRDGSQVPSAVESSS